MSSKVRLGKENLTIHVSTKQNNRIKSAVYIDGNIINWLAG
jgi:hypothetical protein